MSEDLFYSFQISDKTSLCISPLSHSEFVNAEIATLGGEFGYFIYISSPDEGMRVIAKATDTEAAVVIADMLNRLGAFPT